MKRNIKLLVLTLVAVLAMSMGIVFSATAVEPTDTATTTVYSNWWTNDGTTTNFADNKFTISESGQAAAAFANRPSANDDLRENRYKFTLTVSTLDADADFYFTFDARGHGNAPWDLAANSVYFRLHVGYVCISGENFNYATGTNIADGQPHVFDLVIDDVAKTVTLKIDETDYVKQMDAINAYGRFGFFVNQCDVVIDSPSLGFAQKVANTDTMTEWTNWRGSLSFEHFGAANANTRTDAANAGQELEQNRYSFTLTISQVNNPVDFYFYADMRGHNNAPYTIPAGIVFLRLHQSTFYFCDETTAIPYATGMNPADGNAHEFEIVIDDTTKTVTLWIDNAYYTKTLETLNAKGTWGYFGMCATGAVTESAYGYTATAIDVVQANETTTVKMTETLALTATLSPAAATTPVTWSSSNDEIATVDTNGVVTGVGEGTATITATTATGLADTYEVIVTSNIVLPTSVTLDKTAETLSKTQTLQLTATVSPDNTSNKGVTWTTSNANVATVENGLVTVIANSGTATITATCVAATNVKAECVITAAPLNATGIVVSNVKLEVGDVKEFNYTITPAAADDAFAVTVADETKVTYANGKLTAIAAGETTVTVTSNVNSEITATATVTVVTPTSPDGMPTFDANKELSYVMGADPSIEDTITAIDGGYVFDTTASGQTGNTYFPMQGDVPNTTYSANAIEFAVKFDTAVTADWAAAILFRTAAPATAFYSNPSGIGLWIYPGETQIKLHHGQNFTELAKLTDVDLTDGLTHYCAIEVVGNLITVWVDGVKVLDNSDQTENFGTLFNVENNNSFMFQTRYTKLTVTDLHIYNTAMVEEVKYDVTASKTGSGTITGVPEDAVVEGTAITITVTAAEGWQVKSVKVNGTDATLTDGKLSVTVNSDTAIAVEFEEISSGGNEGGDDGKEEKGGCGGFVAFSSSVMAIIALGGASLMFKKKNK